MFGLGTLRKGLAGFGGYGGLWQGRVRNGKAGGSWQVRVRLGKARHGRLKPERRKSEVGRHKQKAILIRHQQV